MQRDKQRLLHVSLNLVLDLRDLETALSTQQIIGSGVLRFQHTD